MIEITNKYPNIEIGNVYGRLTVIEKGERKKGGQYWLCRCSCSNHTEKEIREAYLKNGHTKSCGCLNIEAKQKYNAQKRTKSFEQWCIENKLLHILARWDYELNTNSPSSVGYKSNNDYWFKCPCDKHSSTKHRLDAVTLYYVKYKTSPSCIGCNSFGQYLVDEFGENALDAYWDYNKNAKSPFEIAKCYNGKVYIYCQEKNYHGSYKISCGNFVRGKRCGFCKRDKHLHILDSVGSLQPQILDIWSSKNTKSPYEYAPQSNRKVWWKCENNIHNDYYRTLADSIDVDYRCPECTRERNESFLQEKVRTYINNHYNLETKHEFKCNILPRNPKSNRPLPFDNEVVKLKLIIEVHGISHYQVDGLIYAAARRNNTTPEQEFHKRRLYDRYKRIVAKSSGYFYLEIPYWTDDKNEEWKKLIDNKIEEILHKTIRQVG